MIDTGLKAECDEVVGSHNTASSVGSGDMEVFATPSMIALMERAAMLAVAGELPPGSTTVGTLVEVSHVRATPMGETVRATAFLEAVEGRRLSFRVEAFDSRGVIGEGRHERVVVERERFLAKLSGNN